MGEIVLSPPKVSNVKNILNLLFFPVVRALERILSVRVLWFLLRGVAWPRAFLNLAFRRPISYPVLPPSLAAHQTKSIARRQRERKYLRQILEFFPDRLGEPKWRQLCQVEGLESVRTALQAGRPVILATLHWGVYAQTRLWLRALGLPAATLVGGHQAKRSSAQRRSDHYSPAPTIPVYFYQDQLRELKQHLTAGHPLIVLFDGPAGKKVRVRFSQDWEIELATGALRLAASQAAEIFPLTILDQGQWRTRLTIGPPIPRELLTSPANWQPAAQHLLAELKPALLAHPDQVSPHLAACFHRTV